MESSSFYLSYYEILEILSRCSLEVVDKSKKISRVCNEIGYDPLFQEYHMKKTDTTYGYIMQSIYRNNYLFSYVSSHNTKLPLDFLPPKSQILASSDQGVVCCMTRGNGCSGYRFYVCKLTTKQVRMIPNPKLRYTTDKVAMVVMQSDPLRYKIVRLSQLMNNLRQKYLCEIFDSKIWAWKQTEILFPISCIINGNAVFSRGQFHWLLSSNQILAFDLQTETHKISSLPTLVLNKEFSKKELVKYKGMVGLMCQDLADDYELWVMEDSRNHSWNRIMKIDTKGAKTEEPYCHVVDLYTSNTALVKGYDFMFYNFENSSASADVVKLNSPLPHPKDVFAFRSDYEPVNLGERN